MHGDASIRRLLIVDDHAVARDGLRSLLRGVDDLRVVAEAGSGSEALACCERYEPDLVLMDVHLPDMDGLTVTRSIRKRWSATRVLVMSLNEDPMYRAEAMRAGATGYLPKGATRAELLAAIHGALTVA